MSEAEKENGASTKLRTLPGRAWRWVDESVETFVAGTRNQMRHWRKAQVGYVVIPLGGPLPERSAPPRNFWQRQLPLPAPPLSMQALNARLRAIGDADNVRGVIFLFQGLETGVATLQNFRQSLARLRAAGKESIVFTPYLDLRHYYAGSAADRIYAPPGATFDVLGLNSEILFLRDALQQVGVEVDVVQISPYKTAFDTFQHAEMTPEFREQIDWLLDDQYDILTRDMAEGRGLTQEAFQALIDGAPHFAEEAVSLGLLDGVAYEDELVYLLAEKAEGEDDTAVSQRPKADLKPWSQAERLLTEKVRRSSDRFIGVISLEGMITMGASRTPPIDLPIPFVGGASAGEQTLAALLRRIERMNDLAALIVHVDSGGGSALASDMIGREIERVSQRIPVLTYMGNVAASGGYYVAAQSGHIMSQEITTTGSIGVITLRPSTQALFDKLKVNRVLLKRGEHADLFSDESPMTEAERQIFWEGVKHSYAQFKQVVADGRALPYDDLDPICEGRVWTGRQARARQLVDSHGDFVDAVRQAAQMANLPVDDDHDVRVLNLAARDSRPVIPRPYEAAEEVQRYLSKDWYQALSARPLWLLPLRITLK